MSIEALIWFLFNLFSKKTKTALVSNLNDLELEHDKSQEYSKDELKQIKELIKDE
jgi:hypothetical protein